MKKITIALSVMMTLVLVSFKAGMEYQRGDVDQDGKVGISDVSCLIDYLLSGTWGDTPVTPPDDPQGEHEWVDLGLPGGTLWATCNVGANSPEEYGDYFAWGETEPKEVYSWETYKWCNGTSNELTKYYTDNYTVKIELEPEDDAATVQWGASWRMPSLEEMKVLRNSCTSEWITQNGVRGQLLTGPNGNTLFLPAAGHYNGSSNSGEGADGYYWSRTLDSDCCPLSYDLHITSGQVGWGGAGRSYGLSVRAVRVSQE